MCEVMQRLTKEEVHDNNVEIAEKLLLRSLSIDDIVFCTKLSREEVEAIAERLGKKTA